MSDYAYPISRSDVETMRSWVQQDNQEMEAVRNDPYYRFALMVADACKARTSTWYVRSEYREYMKHHGQLNTTPLANASKIADYISKVLPNADLIYDPETQEPRDPTGATLSESVRRELLSSIQFMNRRQESLKAIQELGHQTGYRNRQLLTTELDVMVESAMALLRNMAPEGTWNNISMDDLILSDDARPLLAQLISLEKYRTEVNNASKPHLHSHYSRIMYQRSQAINALLQVNLSNNNYRGYTTGLTRAGNPIPLMEL